MGEQIALRQLHELARTAAWTMNSSVRITQGWETMIMQETYVGIDIAKEKFDVFIDANKSHHQIDNTEKGFRELIGILKPFKVKLITMEATGTYHSALASALIFEDIPVVVVNPRQVKNFARATGKLAKTDSGDASILCHFGRVMEPPQRELPDERTQRLAQFVSRRRQLVEMRTMEKNRLYGVVEDLAALIKQHICWLDQQIQDLDDDMTRQIKEMPQWVEKAKLLQSVKGVGMTTMVTLIALLPELGALTRQKISSLVGVCPIAHESGQFKGKRMIWGGRAPVRAALYMAALSASKHTPGIKEFYERLLSKGKPKKVALTACIRKLVTILNAMLRDNRPWEPN